MAANIGQTENPRLPGVSTILRSGVFSAMDRRGNNGSSSQSSRLFRYSNGSRIGRSVSHLSTHHGSRHNRVSLEDEAAVGGRKLRSVRTIAIMIFGLLPLLLEVQLIMPNLVSLLDATKIWVYVKREMNESLLDSLLLHVSVSQVTFARDRWMSRKAYLEGGSHIDSRNQNAVLAAGDRNRSMGTATVGKRSCAIDSSTSVHANRSRETPFFRGTTRSDPQENNQDLEKETASSLSTTDGKSQLNIDTFTSVFPIVVEASVCTQCTQLFVQPANAVSAALSHSGKITGSGALRNAVLQTIHMDTGEQAHLHFAESFAPEYSLAVQHDSQLLSPSNRSTDVAASTESEILQDGGNTGIGSEKQMMQHLGSNVLHQHMQSGLPFSFWLASDAYNASPPRVLVYLSLAVLLLRWLVLAGRALVEALVMHDADAALRHTNDLFAVFTAFRPLRLAGCFSFWCIGFCVMPYGFPATNSCMAGNLPGTDMPLTFLYTYYQLSIWIAFFLSLALFQLSKLFALHEATPQVGVMAADAVDIASAPTTSHNAAFQPRSGILSFIQNLDRLVTHRQLLNLPQLLPDNRQQQTPSVYVDGPMESELQLPALSQQHSSRVHMTTSDIELQRRADNTFITSPPATVPPADAQTSVDGAVAHNTAVRIELAAGAAEALRDRYPTPGETTATWNTAENGSEEIEEDASISLSAISSNEAMRMQATDRSAVGQEPISVLLGNEAHAGYILAAAGGSRTPSLPWNVSTRSVESPQLSAIEAIDSWSSRFLTRTPSRRGAHSQRRVSRMQLAREICSAGAFVALAHTVSGAVVVLLGPGQRWMEVVWLSIIFMSLEVIARQLIVKVEMRMEDARPGLFENPVQNDANPLLLSHGRWTSSFLDIPQDRYLLKQLSSTYFSVAERVVDEVSTSAATTPSHCRGTRFRRASASLAAPCCAELREPLILVSERGLPAAGENRNSLLPERAAAHGEALDTRAPITRITSADDCRPGENGSLERGEPLRSAETESSSGSSRSSSSSSNDKTSSASNNRFSNRAIFKVEGRKVCNRTEETNGDCEQRLSESEYYRQANVQYSAANFHRGDLVDASAELDSKTTASLMRSPTSVVSRMRDMHVRIPGDTKVCGTSEVEKSTYADAENYKKRRSRLLRARSEDTLEDFSEAAGGADEHYPKKEFLERSRIKRPGYEMNSLHSHYHLGCGFMKEDVFPLSGAQLPSLLTHSNDGCCSPDYFLSEGNESGIISQRLEHSTEEIAEDGTWNELNATKANSRPHVILESKRPRKVRSGDSTAVLCLSPASDSTTSASATAAADNDTSRYRLTEEQQAHAAAVRQQERQKRGEPHVGSKLEGEQVVLQGQEIGRHNRQSGMLHSSPTLANPGLDAAVPSLPSTLGSGPLINIHFRRSRDIGGMSEEETASEMTTQNKDKRTDRIRREVSNLCNNSFKGSLPLCDLCAEVEADIVLLPCGHGGLCEKCALRMVEKHGERVIRNNWELSHLRRRPPPNIVASVSENASRGEVFPLLQEEQLLPRCPLCRQQVERVLKVDSLYSCSGSDTRSGDSSETQCGTNERSYTVAAHTVAVLVKGFKESATTTSRRFPQDTDH